MVHQGESIIVRRYGKRHGKGGMLFNAIICFCALLYCIFTECFKTEYAFYFPKELWIYGMISGLFYAIGFYAAYLALKLGSFGLTKLISSFGTLIPITYGIVFLKEPTTAFTFISITLILISLFLTKYQKNTDPDAPVITFKWVVSIVTFVLANAGISIVAKSQQLRFATMCSNEYLAISYTIAAVLLLVLTAFYERSSFRTVLKNGIVYGVFAGLLNGLKNILVILTYLYVPISIVSPVKTALGLVISFVISVIFYKESFTKRQLIGVAIGIIAVLLIKL